MTSEEIATHYPDCQQAVLVHEKSLCALVWEALRYRAQLAGLDDTLRMMRLSIQSRFSSRDELPPEHRNLQEEMDTPGFRRYLQAKLGAM